jgi:hypothetical protein
MTKENMLGSACIMITSDKFTKHEGGEKPLERSKHRYKDNIKIDAEIWRSQWPRGMTLRRLNTVPEVRQRQLFPFLCCPVQVQTQGNLPSAYMHSLF